MNHSQQAASDSPAGAAARLDPYMVLSLFISAVAALPVLGPYFVGSHDGILAVYRFFQFDRSIQDGILLPRWAPDLFFGYGYPFFNFYAPLSYYVAEGFHLLGLGFVNSISGTFALGFVLSGFFMYLLGRDLGGPWAGLLAALAYVFAPYHLVDAHLRGDLAEFFAFVWFPAILWAAGRLISRRSLGYLALTALFYGALLTTHNIMALAFSPLLAAYVAFLLLRERTAPALGRRAFYAISAIALAFGLSAFFWMPALQQVNEIQIGRLDYDPNYYYRTSLMQGSSFISDGLIQDYGPRSPGGDFGYPVELGLVQVIMATAALGLLVWQRRKGKNEVFGHLSFLTLAALVYYAIMFPWSLFLWEKVPLMSYLQSPWRLLPFLTLSTAVLIGYLGRWAACLRSRWGTVALGLLVLLATVPNVVNLQPRYVDLREDDVSLVGSLRFEMLSQNLGMTASAEYLPKGVRSKMATSPIALDTISSNQPPSPFDPSFLAAGAGVEVLEARSTVARFRVNSPGGTPFLFNQTYFPGWKAYLDGQEMALNGVGTANLMSLQVPSGSHNLEFRFEETRVRLLGKAVSLASLIALLVILLIALRQRLRAPPGPVKFNQAGLNTGSLNRPLLFIGLIAIEALIGAYLAPRMDSPSQAVAPFRAEATWSGGPTLLGYDLNSATFRPGQSIGLVLYWSERPPSQEVRIGVKGRTGRVWSQGVSNPVPPQDERDAKRTYQITLPKDIPPGMYQITLDILSNGKPLPILKEGLARPIFPEKSVLLGPVFIGRGEPVTEERVNVTTRRETNLENQVALLGYDLTVGARSLDLTTYWKTLSIMREDYAIFAHLLDLGDKVLVFNDLNPEGNPYATTLWRPGEVVTVPFHFDLPPDFQPESHRLRIGLYTPDNFHRLSVLDAAGQPVTNTIFLPLMPSPGK